MLWQIVLSSCLKQCCRRCLRMEEAAICFSAALCAWDRTVSHGANCCGASFQRRGARALRSSSVCWVTPSRCRDGQATAEDWTPRVREVKHATCVYISISTCYPRHPFLSFSFCFSLTCRRHNRDPVHLHSVSGPRAHVPRVHHVALLQREQTAGEC